ncbi:acyl-CoA thioesterase [Gordonia insulae]|uniref:Acyl-CoA thioesterase 2 n=1 Tax=Gordonia insulae TaxID=2420509 RepID=A0A3G8JM03_9ACTN|nr:acyl-CoA thioesterase domain-containing protein [Gordonia insulae]AZG45928.1 Acyl-CoA thioesterase 2 [Gordonia insulae]
MPLSPGTGASSSIDRPSVGGILDVCACGPDSFRGDSYTRARRVYGGQTLGQAMTAAGRTVHNDHRPHSLHGHFIHPGRSDVPVDYTVERIRDGETFSTRQVRGSQGDRIVLIATVSFQQAEHGLAHQDTTATPAPTPEALPRFEDSVSASDLGDARWLRRLLSTVGVEFRFPEEYPRLANRRGEPRPPVQRAWIRTCESLDDNPLTHAAGFAYCSDLFLLSAALPPHARHIDTPGMQLASLDHAVWLHAPFRADEWHLYEQHGYWMGNGRGISSGRLFDRDGILLASTMQEGLLRFR